MAVSKPDFLAFFTHDKWWGQHPAYTRQDFVSVEPFHDAYIVVTPLDDWAAMLGG